MSSGPNRIGVPALSVVALLLGSCYAPTHHSCTISCGESDLRCPTGLECDHGWCRDPILLDRSSCDPCHPVDDESRTTIFVNVSSPFEAPVGSATCPYPTITAGLAAADRSRAERVTVEVAAGTYSTGERFPLVVRGNVTLRGAGASSTIVVGEGRFAHAAEGGLLDDDERHATVLFGDRVGTPALSDLTLRRDLPTPKPNLYGVVCDRGRTGGVGQDPLPPSATIDRVVIGPGFDTAIVVTNTATSSCNLSLAASTLIGDANGVWLAACGAGAGVLPVAADLGDGTTGGGNRFELVRNVAAFNATAGVVIWDCVTRTRIRGNLFTGSQHGIASATHNPEDGIEIEGNTFTDLTEAGINLAQRTRVRALRGNTFRNVSSPTIASVAPAVLLQHSSSIPLARSNLFVGNDAGVRVMNDPIGPDRVIDFGRADDPGGNVFRCNSAWSPTGAAYDVWIDVNGPSTGTALFDGNAWDHLPPTTVRGGTAPNGTDLRDSQRNGGVNPISATAPAQATEECPANRTE